MIKTVPSFYNPWVHLLLPSSLGLVIIFTLFRLMDPLSLLELVMVPITLAVMSSWEWLIHKYWMHHSFKPFTFLFKKHRLHHQYYTDKRMELSSWNELYFILTPFWALVLVFTALVPMFIVASFVSWNVACLVVMTTMLYFVVYELTHATYHFPKSNWIRSNPIINYLSKHHTLHHNTKNMTRFNFNVSFPLFDWLTRTNFKN